ncbi:MAG: diguanylate cyclase domain-containing protein [Vibrio sp.]|uniref:sensor domain-containing diguanylate cyclase n=1 Tax=Vibrio sp. TaxID=678 RepID=UPI003A8B4F81
MTIKTRKNIKEIVLTSFMVSLIFYTIFMLFYIDSHINERELQFEKFTKTVAQYNQVLFFTGKILESEVSKFDAIEEGSKDLLVNQSGDFYRFNDINELTNIDIAIENEFHQLVDEMPTILPERDVMYYRSYTSSLTSVDKKGVNIEIEQCLGRRNCALEAPDRRLSDRILISDPYRNGDGDVFITISSPIYFQNVIVGDVNIDIFMPRFDGASNVHVEKKLINGVAFYELIYGNSTMGGRFAYTINFVADNSTVYVYKVPVQSIVYRTVMFFLVIWLVSGFVMFRFKELNLNKIKLSEAQSSIVQDQMTGLLNRNALESNDFKSAIKDKGASILAIDGNKLKAINDTYGHHVGDEAIKQIANAMKEVFRDTDYLIRSGGDEFLAVLPGCKNENALSLAARLKETVGATTFSPYALNVGVSVGVAEMMENEPIESVIRRADENLYTDKQQ